MHDGDAVGEVRMGVPLGRRAMGRPAGVGNADRAGKRLFAQPDLQIDELAFGAPALQLAANDGGDTGGIIAAVLQALQRIDQSFRYRLVANDAYNTAHSRLRIRPRAVIGAPVQRGRKMPPGALPW